MSTSRETLRRRSQSSSALVVLGGGRGLACVLKALKDEDRQPTVIVRIAYDGVGSDENSQRLSGPAVEDLRRSLEAMTGEEGALLRAMRRPLTIESLGERPLGNLVIASVGAAIHDYGRASIWLGQQLGIGGAVLPATVEPVHQQIQAPMAASKGGSEPGLPRLRFVGEHIRSPDEAVAAIKHARWVLLAPGSLYRSVVSTAAVPDLAAALKSTRARVIWIANLEPGLREAASMTAIDQLGVLQLHGVRVDVVLHDPSARLRFDLSELTEHGVESVARALRSSRNPAVHDPGQLRSALGGLIGSQAAASRAHC